MFAFLLFFYCLEPKIYCLGITIIFKTFFFFTTASENHDDTLYHRNWLALQQQLSQ